MIDVTMLKKYKYISFDIFDTLIVRNVKKPSDIFKLVEKDYDSNIYLKKSNFYENRISSEELARNNSNYEEITLNDIYSILPYSLIEKKILKKMELEYEFNFCQSNSEIYNIYKYCIDNNIKVIITSDMYLELNIIKKILKSCGIHSYEKIYLSSDLKKTKSKGTIFEYIIKDLKVSASDILHIGDNMLSDYIIPQRMGIDAIHYTKKCYINNKKNILEYTMLNAFINNNCENNSYYYKFGFSCFGPILYGFVKWLEANARENNIDKLFFLSRDGYMIEKAFEIINKDIRHTYMYASRRSIIVPSLHKCKDVSSILSCIKFPSEITVNEMINRLGIENCRIDDYLKKNNIKLEDTFQIDNISNNMSNFLNDIFPVIVKNSKEEYTFLKKYLKDINFGENLNVVDIGWHGTMQDSLEKLLSKNIKGFYVGTRVTDKNKYGYLFSGNDNNEINYKLRYMNAIFESCFLGNHGSVKKFSNNGVIFYDLEYSSKELSIYKELQNGALDFIKKVSNSKFSLFITDNKYLLSENMLNFSIHPTKEDIKFFNQISFFDNVKYNILSKKSKKYYFIHPLTFYKDFKKSLWKPAFVKKYINSNLYSNFIEWRFLICKKK